MKTKHMYVASLLKRFRTNVTLTWEGGGKKKQL